MCHIKDFLLNLVSNYFLENFSYYRFYFVFSENHLQLLKINLQEPENNLHLIKLYKPNANVISMNS